jgi:RHS repeat-associated protein
MINAFRSLLALVALVLVASVASGQVKTGTPPFGSFGGGPDMINLANLNSHISIPVLHRPGRGLNFTYDLSYDSSVWYPVAGTWQPVQSWGWRAATEAATGYISDSGTITGTCNPSGHAEIPGRITVSNWVYHDPFGISHSFSGSAIINTGNCPAYGGPNSTGFTSTATDGSGYNLAVTGSPTTTILVRNVFAVDGTNETVQENTGTGAASGIDRNGNQITVSGSGVFTDTLGTTALAVAGVAPSNTTFTYTAPSGSPAAYTMKYTTYTVQTKFNCSGITEYGANGTTTASLVSEIDLPDGVSKYTFAYEPTPGVSGKVTGRLASVTLPTGGTISYGYSGSNNGINCSDGSTATLQRTTPDGVWTYAQVKGTGAATTTTVTAPQLPYDSAANQTVIQFQGIYETQSKIYQGSTSGTLLTTANTCYNGAASPCTGTAVTLPITQRTVTSTVPGPGGLQLQHTDKYNSLGLTIESDDYDFATGAPFPLVRQTLVTYAPLGGNLNAFAQTVTVKDGAGVIKSRQDTNYDQYSSFTGGNCISGAPNHNDTGYGCSFTARANATSVTTYTDPITPGGAITKNFTYDSLGNLRTAQLNCCQLKTWNYSLPTKYAYPDSIVSGSSSPTLTTSITYDLNMGLPLTTTDPNNVQSVLTYDNMGRVLTAKIGTNPTTNYTYTDSGSWSVKTCSPVQGTNTACQNTILDSLGRPKTTQLLDGSSTLYSASDTQYDPLGHAYKVSNPYTSSPAYWTQTNFDALGRGIKTTLPDNSLGTASYSDNTATTTDPAGKQRKTVSNGLGRLISVYEPDPSSGNTLTLQTSYAYNVLDELTQVTQGVQTRTYVYDALGRLSSSTTPEAGTMCLGTLSGSTCQQNGYDSYDNLVYRTDARGVVTNYLYDGLNRLVGVSYPTVPSGVAPMPNVCKVNGSGTNNANVCFAFGTAAASFNNGRITSMSDPSGSESYTYDQFGNVTQLAKVVGATTYTSSYAYNLANQLTSITYPSGRIVQQNLDTIGRLSSVVGTLNSVNTTYASGFVYSAAQQVTGFNYGNSINTAFGYAADRLQRTCLDYSTTNRNGVCAHDATTKFGMNYNYPVSPANNAQISGITDTVDSGRSASYTYDALHRLSTATTTGSTGYPAWGLSWTYDRYGNRSAQTVTAGTGMPSNSVTIDAVHNRVSGSPYAYDATGNMTNDGQNTLTYDGENHAATAVNGSNSGTYTYDGGGLRVKKVSVVSGVTTTTVYMFSGSQVIAEYDNGAAVASPSREYIYSGVQRIATILGSTTIYQHSDKLSVRILTDASGNIVGQRGHYPYGESWYETGTLTKVKFTTYERDSESGNDYAMDRTYVSGLGRFSAVDPLSGSTSDPQSLNGYSYTLNDPINLVDPTGDSSISDSVSCTSSAAASSCSGYGLGPGPGYGNNLGAPGVGTSHTAEEKAAYEAEVVGLTYEYTKGQYHKTFDSWGDYAKWLVNCGGDVECSAGASDESNGSQSLTPSPGQGPSGGGGGGGSQQDCLTANIAAVNKVSNLNVSSANVTNSFFRRGAWNYDFSVPGGSTSSLPAGRYPSSIFNAITGIGPSLHVPPNDGGNPNADPSIYGMSSSGAFTFTTHIDSAYATWHTPLGAFLHWFIDVRSKGAHRRPC